MTYFRLLVFLLLPLLARAQAPGYEVVGHIGGLPDGTRLYLIDGGQRKRIDSATVARGAFVFQGRLAEPAFIYLYLGRGKGSSKLADFLLDNLRLTVTGEKPDYANIKVSGSEDNEHLNEWFRADEQLGSTRAKVGRVYRVLQVRQDTSAVVLKSVLNELQQARIALLKDYVRRYHATATGAALPTLCTLLTSLTAADYTEMYQALAPHWQQSAFGTEIQAQIRKRTPRPPAAN